MIVCGRVCIIINYGFEYIISFFSDMMERINV